MVFFVKYISPLLFTGKDQESIVLQHQESYFIGIILVGFFALISIGLALNLYARYILKERKSSTFESLGALNWIWLLINVLYCFIYYIYRNSITYLEYPNQFRPEHYFSSCNYFYRYKFLSCLYLASAQISRANYLLHTMHHDFGYFCMLQYS